MLNVGERFGTETLSWNNKYDNIHRSLLRKV